MEGIAARSGEKGKVKFFRDDDGWGFIEPDGGGQDVFFHANDLACSFPFAGEHVIYDVVQSPSPDHDVQATSVRRPAMDRHTGDVIDWHVEPGTRRTVGHIAPHSSDGLIQFTYTDFWPTLRSEGKKVRPWHAAEYSELHTSGGPTAVDISLDTRYPLQRFAYLGDESEMLQQLQMMALPENWDYRSSPNGRTLPILHSFLHFTFARLRDEDRLCPEKSRKVRVRSDLGTPLAAFNTGLVDQKYKPIYALFESNEPGHSVPWRFRAFCIPGEGHGKVLASHFNPLPRAAQYFETPAELLFDPDRPLHPDYTHILTHNRDRLPKDLLVLTQNMEEQTAIRTLTMYLDEAINVARERCRWNYRTAIPHYFPSFKRLEFLLPLCLVSDNRVDVALSVQQTETGYIASTILELDWAYRSARLICRPDSDWLVPTEIEEGQAEPDDDVELLSEGGNQTDIPEHE